MLSLSKEGTKLLIKRGIIYKEQAQLYEYGFELLFSFIVTLCCLLILGVLGDVFEYTIVFLAYFVPIRILAGGYHAKSQWSCLVLTNVIMLTCIILSMIAHAINSAYIELIIWWIGILSYIYIWKMAPIIPMKYRSKTKRYDINRRYAHCLIKVEIIILTLLAASQGPLFYMAVLTKSVVAILMKYAIVEV